MRDGRAEAQDQAADRRRMVSRMKVNRPKPLDLPKSFKDQRVANAAAPTPRRISICAKPTSSRMRHWARWRPSTSGWWNQDAAADLPPLDLIEATRESTAGAAPRAWPFYVAAAALSALWSLAPIMFAWGYRREVVPFDNDIFAMAVFAMLAIGPAVLVWVAAFLLHQGRGAGRRGPPGTGPGRGHDAAGRDGRARRRLGGPTGAPRDRTGHRRGGQRPRGVMTLRDLLAEESERLAAAAAGSSRSAANGPGDGGRAREDARTGRRLGAQATGVVDAVSQQARMVAEATDLAETRIREAEAAWPRARPIWPPPPARRAMQRAWPERTSRARSRGWRPPASASATRCGCSRKPHRTARGAGGDGPRRARRPRRLRGRDRNAKGAADRSPHPCAGPAPANSATSRPSSAQALSQLIAQAGGELSEVAQSAAEQRDLFTAAAAQSLGALSEIGRATSARRSRRQTREGHRGHDGQSDATRKAVQDQAALESRSDGRRRGRPSTRWPPAPTPPERRPRPMPKACDIGSISWANRPSSPARRPSTTFDARIERGPRADRTDRRSWWREGGRNAPPPSWPRGSTMRARHWTSSRPCWPSSGCGRAAQLPQEAEGPRRARCAESD